ATLTLGFVRPLFLLLGLLVTSLLASSVAHAFGEDDKLVIGQIVYQGNWNPRPSGPRRLAWEIDKRTSIDAAIEPAPVHLNDEKELRRYPFLYLAGDAAFAAPDEADVARLRHHLQAGGFLVIDGSDPRPGGGFDQSVRALVKRIFPKDPLTRLQ